MPRRALLAVAVAIIVVDLGITFTQWQALRPPCRTLRRNSAEPRFAHASAAHRRRLRPSVQEVTRLFFQKAKGYQEEAARFQVASSISVVAEMYASVLLHRQRQKPAGRSVILVPWLGRGEEILRVLQEHGLKASLLSHQSAESSPYDSVLVCVHRSVRLLAGCNFDVKIIDEASFLRHSTKTKASVQRVPANLVAEFSFNFGSEEVDYRYSLQQATSSDQLRPVECFGLPIAAPDREARQLRLAQWIGRQQHNWPGTVTMALFYRAQAAAKFCEILHNLGVEGCGYDDLHVSSAGGQKRVFSVSKGRSGDFAVAGLQTVILAEPTRQPSSAKYLQYLLQNVWKDDFQRSRVLIEVLDGNGRESTVQRRLQVYQDHLVAVSPALSPQLLDFCGRSFQASQSNLRSLLEDQGRREEAPWLQSLYAWLREHQRKPRSHAADVEESRQAERLQRGYNYLRQEVFSQKEAALFSACNTLLGARDWLQNCSNWLQQTGRAPKARARDAEERKHAKRWQLARRYLEMGKLNPAEKQLVENCLEHVDAREQILEIREWMQSLAVWLRSHGKPRYSATEPQEKMQARRLVKAKALAQAGKLNLAESQLLKEVLATESKQRPWLRDLTNWVQHHGRKPRLNAEERLEHTQAIRWSRAVAQEKKGELSEEEQSLFHSCRGITEAERLVPTG